MKLDSQRSISRSLFAASLTLASPIALQGDARGAPILVDPTLQTSVVASGLSQPTTMAFIGPSDLLVLEKATGQVKRVTNGVVQGTVLDLAVNSGSERGLLGIALQPNFPASGGVYLYWTESSTGADTNSLASTPLLGNRVDRFVWNGSNLTLDTNIARFRARQNDANQPERGNHNGGAMRFGPDGKLYVAVGDVGRRGQLQNLPGGPAGNGTPDDQYGGPAPDNAHFTGTIVRLNADGSTPADNPFFAAGAAIGGEPGANIQKIFGYGIRNSFGMAFDPLTGHLWMADNGDDAFDEINRVQAGMNGGWVQAMGPLSRIDEYKSIETTFGGQNLQQVRWPPSNIADNPADALARMFTLPGAQYSDPEFSWKYGVAPGAAGFLSGTGLGANYDGDLFVGAGGFLDPGRLFRFKLDALRNGFAFTDADLADLVADNLTKFDLTESESLLFGSDFGATTDIQTGPDGRLYVVSHTLGTIYAISSLTPGGAVPEPHALALVALALAALAFSRRRRLPNRALVAQSRVRLH